ncbi:MAG TPA: hypothetical protein PLV92_28675, partial [Pirellulaceae bacterium]|nr:hypothetical protein [Pirellulaceae bacterium]
LVSSAVGGTGAARKERRGKLVLAGDNWAFDSTLAIASGVVAIQHSNALGDATANGATTVSSGAALELESGISVVANESLTISGTGYGNDGSGALRNRSGANVWNGPISLGSSVAAIGVGANSDGLYASPSSGSSDVLSLSSTLAISTESLVKSGDGTLELIGTGKGSGGGLFVNAGSLRLNMTTGNLGASVYVGTNDGGASGVQVVYAPGAVGDQIGNSSTVSLARSGRFDFLGATDQIGSLSLVDGQVVNSGVGGQLTVSSGIVMTGGSINSGSGVVATSGDITINVGGQATIAGRLLLNNAARTMTVASGPAFYDVALTADVDGGGSLGRLVKSGAGGLSLSGNNRKLTGGSDSVTLSVDSTI